ncbi:unnamed protein product [Cuscuta campestris]|uniref:Uncharacterized protein n=1 Tax=Cuscuta campestris TaxID=132261 RepID=A0A484LCZ0_9ASTE|nr:unnamed protein product [Cuscuta campestris]
MIITVGCYWKQTTTSKQRALKLVLRLGKRIYLPRRKGVRNSFQDVHLAERLPVTASIQRHQCWMMAAGLVTILLKILLGLGLLLLMTRIFGVFYVEASKLDNGARFLLMDV